MVSGRNRQTVRVYANLTSYHPNRGILDWGATPSRVLFEQYYGSRTIHLFFNLWYKDFDYSPASDENGPQVDHIFPQSLLKTVKDVNPDSGKRNLLHYRAEQRDQIANCMLLTAAENGFNSKTDTPPAKWFAPQRFDRRRILAGSDSAGYTPKSK
jgi:hypothetical protein